MSNGYFKVEMPKNEPVKAYLPGSPERASLKKELERQSAQVVQVPMSSVVRKFGQRERPKQLCRMTMLM